MDDAKTSDQAIAAAIRDSAATHKALAELLEKLVKAGMIGGMKGMSAEVPVTFSLIASPKVIASA